MTSDRWPYRTVLSPVLHKGDDEHWQGNYLHFCPGCQTTHMFAVDKPFHNGAKWTYNGDPDKPTFHPSMNITWPQMATDENGVRREVGTRRCHYFVKEGKIQFLGDCTHALKGQTVPMPVILE